MLTMNFYAYGECILTQNFNDCIDSFFECYEELIENIDIDVADYFEGNPHFVVFDDESRYSFPYPFSGELV